MSGMASWYVRRGEKIRGPFDGSTILRLLAEKQLTMGDECRPAEAQTWTALAAIPEVANAVRLAQAPMPDVAPVLAANKRPEEALGIIALIVPFAATGAVWLWIGQMNRFEDPGGKLSLLTLATVGMTSLLSAIEASQLGFGSQRDLDAKGRRRSGPVAWFFFVALMWAIAFPVYMWRRSTYGAKNMAFGGAIVAIVYTASAWLMAGAIYR